MRFWDSSALVALVIRQASSTQLQKLFSADPEVLCWALSEVEVMSALARLEREKTLSMNAFKDACESLDLLWASVAFVSLLDGVKLRAKRLLRVHPLRAADACQLGAALLSAHDDPSGWSFVCLDIRLRDAAGREGFSVLP